MKRSGYTLIELIIVLAILGCISCIALPSIQSSKEDMDNKKLSDATSGVIEFINYCKCYCRAENTSGVIKIGRNYLILDTNLKVRRKYYIPQGIILNTGPAYVKNDTVVKTLHIYRTVLESGSIYVVNPKGKYNVITIKVGTHYVST